MNGTVHQFTFSRHIYEFAVGIVGLEVTVAVAFVEFEHAVGDLILACLVGLVPLAESDSLGPVSLLLCHVLAAVEFHQKVIVGRTRHSEHRDGRVVYSHATRVGGRVAGRVAAAVLDSGPILDVVIKIRVAR
jgi:hypothetical protein